MPLLQRRHLLPIAAVSCVVGLAWVLLFPLVTVSTGELECRGLFISENAFPRGFRTSSILQTHDQVAPRLQAAYASSDGVASDSRLERQWFSRALVDVGASVASVGEDLGVLVATVRAVGRGSHKEAIVLAAPFPSSRGAANATSGAASDENDHPDGAFVLLSLASLLVHDAPWLSKDVLLVFGSDYSAWLQAYVGSKYPTVGTAVTPAHLLPRSGALRLAAVLDWPAGAGAASRPSAYGILTQAPYGRLPDMDLVVYLIRTVESTLHAPLVLSGSARRVPAPASDRWSTTISDMFRFMSELAFGPYAPHAPFLERSIDSVTIRPVEVPTADGGRPLSRAGLLRLLEAFVEAGSNLEERLHASFYFYVLLSPTLFVSIGEYVYPGVLACILPAVAVIGASAPDSAAQFVAGGAVTLTAVLTSAGIAGLAAAAGVPASPIAVIAIVAVAELVVCVQLATLWASVPRSAVLTAAVLAAGLVHAPLGMLNFSFVLLAAVPSLIPATLLAAGAPTTARRPVATAAVVVGVLASAPCVVLAAGVAWVGAEAATETLATLLSHHHWSAHPQLLYLLGLYLPVHSVLLGLVTRPVRPPRIHNKQD